MKLINPLNALRNATSDIWRMHDFNYEIPTNKSKNFWEKECLEHPTSANCKMY